MHCIVIRMMTMRMTMIMIMMIMRYLWKNYLTDMFQSLTLIYSNIAIILQLFDKILIANRGEIACRVCNIDLGACNLSLHFYYILSLYMNFLFPFIFRSWKHVNVLELKLLLSIVKQMQMLWVYHQNTFSLLLCLYFLD